VPVPGEFGDLGLLSGQVSKGLHLAGSGSGLAIGDQASAPGGQYLVSTDASGAIVLLIRVASARGCREARRMATAGSKLR
jgi:hypothetical protein